ncbi:MAG TPA: ABC transporter permease, partial [Pyrinomonadaceae bacterium]|nr:ABC transporter permease [Pyrinomonadaceae bacterium]
MEQELDEELRAYVELLTAEKIKRGLDAAEARRAALIETGGIEQVKAQVRDVRIGIAMDSLWQDVQFGARMLRKHPGFTLIAVTTLALGIGANTVIFSAFNAVMLRPLPYKEPDRIVTVWDTYLQIGANKYGVAYANFVDLKERSRDVFEPLALYQAASNTTFNLTGLAGPERIQGTRATGDFFRALGVAPFLGRTIATEDEAPGRNHVVVLSYNLWQRVTGGDAQIINKVLRLNDEDYQVLGVMPQGFQFPSGLEMPPGQQFAAGTDIWTPLTVPNDPTVRGDRVRHSYRAVARLKPGVTVEQAQARTRDIIAQLVNEHPDENIGLGSSVLSLHENQVGAMRPAMIALLIAVGFVLAIACTNIANLLLSRATVRQKEFAVRAALGASRRRILQQLLTESLLLAIIGGALGVLLSVVALRSLAAFVPANIPRMGEVNLDWRVLVFTFSLSLLTGVLFGLVPALQASKPDLIEGVKSDGRGMAGSAGHKRLRHLLVVSEVVLVFMLLIAAGLMLKSFRRLQAVAAGFDPQHVLTARVTLPASSYSPQRKLLFYRQLVERLSQSPGVQAAAVIRDLPLSGTDPRYSIAIEGRPDTQQGFGLTVRVRIISSDYFKAMGIQLKQGRYFSNQDNQHAPGVALINESAAREFFPQTDAVGQTLLTVGGYAPDKCQLVGVVGDVKFGGLDTQAEPEIYVPFEQLPESFIQPGIGSMAIVLKGVGEPTELAGGLRQEVAAIDRNVPVTSILSMEELLAGSLAPRRFNLLLLVIFACVSLSLAAVGIYGVLSY